MTTSPVAAILATLTQDPGRPRLTWYGPDDERVELSGAVLANWVTKTSNLLVEELDAAPGTVVALDLPAHWRTLVWALAVWRTGATLSLVSPKDDEVEADVAITHRPEAWAAYDVPLVAVALPALARSFGDGLPAGALDAAGAVMTYGDALGPVVDPVPDSLAIVTGAFRGAVTVSYNDLVDWAESARVAPQGDRILLTSDADCVTCADEPTTHHADHLGRRGKLLQTLRSSLNAWSTGGSVVLLDPTQSERIATREARAHLVEIERIGR